MPVHPKSKFNMKIEPLFASALLYAMKKGRKYNKIAKARASPYSPDIGVLPDILGNFFQKPIDPIGAAI